MPQPHQDPFAYFTRWFDEAQAHAGIAEANAVNLATSGANGRPSNRMVLLKSYDAQGFVFYTNLQSRKAGQLQENAFAAMCFYWEVLGKQIRIEGSITPVSDAEADAYFASRPLKSRIGAWASQQSKPLKSQAALLAEIAKQTARFATQTVPRPEHWSGFRLVPDRMEFWQKGEYRLHQRECFTREKGEDWQSQLLYP